MVVLKDGVNTTETAIAEEIRSLIREKIGAIACLKTIKVVERLPKTRSGKILRKNLRQLVDGEDIIVPSTIDDPAIIEELKQLWDMSQHQ